VIYDYYKEKGKFDFKGKMVAAAAALIIAIIAVISTSIYMEIIQLDEIGKLSSVYITNIKYKILFSAVSFALIFIVISITNVFVKRNIKEYLKENGHPDLKLPNYSISFVISAIGAFLVKDQFYQKALNFLNASSFDNSDPIFGYNIGYFVLQRPFLMSIYGFISTLWLFVIVYTLAYYALVIFSLYNNITMQDLKVRSLLRHNLINIALFFLIKAFSYKFEREGILFSNFVGVTGAGYVDVNLWLKYFYAAPIIIAVIVIASFIYIWRGRLRNAAYTISVFPAVWFLVTLVSVVLQGFIVKPNEINLESPYLKYNMEKTREAYNIDKIIPHDFNTMTDLTPDILKSNSGTVDNIRIVDYNATMDNINQLQSNTNFYSFADGDIINYRVNNREMPVFIAAREIDKNKLPDKTYINNTLKYTHGYGVVVNYINSITSEGQVDFILRDLAMNTKDPAFKLSEPRIYYGELTKDQVIVNAGGGLKEIDYDGTTETTYKGTGGIKMNLMNRLLFAMKYQDMNMLISGYVTSESKLLLNRDVVARAKRAVPFLTIDNDPYMIITSDGRLKWVLDAYTMTDQYPYSQFYGYNSFNYIKNSVKVVIDAYDGDAKYYIIDKNDPIINTYKKIYPGIFNDGPLPQDVALHSRYPEFLFRVQTDIMKRYHLDPKANPQNISTFYSKQDLWDIAKYPEHNSAGGVDTNKTRDIDAYYNMIRLPGNLGSKEELILMIPFTPSTKNNMVSWLAVRNSAEKYGELILFNFPKNTNIYGPYQVDTNINTIDKVSKDLSLWNTGGSRAFKGSLLVIPIENSVLYVEPIYVKSSGPSSIPQIKEIVVGYQKGEEVKYGVGATLDDALNQLFAGIKAAAPAPPPAVTPGIAPGTQEKANNEKIINDIISKYDSLKQQLDEMGKLINELKK